MIKHLIIILLSVCCAGTVYAQVPEIPPVSSTTEQQLESITENNEDIVTEDDSFLQEMRRFLSNPINLNSADVAELKELFILTPIQMQNLIAYRKVFGNFINIYELQAVPGWDIGTIQKIRPYITVSSTVNIITAFNKRLSGGRHSILIRSVYVPEKARGYEYDANKELYPYPGSGTKLFVRYKYVYKNLLQFGITGEKDAGEEFFKGSQKQGFDFYSAHLFARNIGIIKALAIGDFAVNMGQGLTQWQSLAFKKSADITNIKRQLPVLRPYNSAGEINFHRGAGITIARNNVEATAFASYRKLDANFNAGDTLNAEDNFITSLQTSGYHRTKAEIADKGTQTQIAFGGNIAYNNNRLHVGINGIQYRFNLPLYKSPDPYNRFALSGKNFGNCSVDYSYTFKNMHLFGEAASNNTFDKAFVNGLLISAAARVDMSFVYRNISKKYQSLYTNAFTESTYPNNEKGMYTGVSVRPNDYWKIGAYADFYKFDWLKYRVDAPTTGTDYLLQATYKPNKQLELYSQYRVEAKAINYNRYDSIMSQVVAKPRQDMRVQLNYKTSAAITLRSRVEMVWYDKKGGSASNGFLTYFDVLYKPMMKKYSGNVRLLYVETDDYNSRIYTYENDVLYSFSIPVFSGKQLRYYINLNYDITKKLSVWIKWAQSIAKGQDNPIWGSGLDQITSPTKSEIKLQALYQF